MNLLVHFLHGLQPADALLLNVLKELGLISLDRVRTFLMVLDNLDQFLIALLCLRLLSHIRFLIGKAFRAVQVECNDRLFFLVHRSIDGKFCLLG